MPTSARAEIIIVHSSDLHLGTDDSFSNADRLETLPKVLRAASEMNADLVLLAGDSFDNHRQPEPLLQRASQILHDYGKRIVILPGNHDPLTPDSVYRRGGLANVPNVSILGLNVDETVTFSDLELSIWGKAHVDYTDMSPLASPGQRAMRWHIAAAHGHYVDEIRDPNRLIGSWLIHREELDAVDADYVALGHWNQATKVGDDNKHAYYSGSPEYTGTVNVVQLQDNGVIKVLPAALNGRHK
jgi:DNA repair exonuclease SbcCD nuclease subunit